MTDTPARRALNAHQADIRRLRADTTPRERLAPLFTVKRRDVEIPASCRVLHRDFNLTFYGRWGECPRLVQFDPALGYVPGNIRVVSCAAAGLQTTQRSIKTQEIAA